MSTARSLQRRQADRERVDAVVEVLAEPALADEHVERPVGRRDQAEVDVDGSVAAEALEAALLEHAQQLGLRDQRQVADLVEEQRAAVGQLEAPGLAVVRAGEGALLVAEDFRFEQRVGQRRAVDRLEASPGRGATARESCAPRLPCRRRSGRGSAPRCRTWRRCESTRRWPASSRRGRSSRGSAAPTATTPRCRRWRGARGRCRAAPPAAPLGPRGRDRRRVRRQLLRTTPKSTSSRTQLSTSSRMRPNVCISASMSKASLGRARSGSAGCRRAAGDCTSAANRASRIAARAGVGRGRDVSCGNVMSSTEVSNHRACGCGLAIACDSAGQNAERLSAAMPYRAPRIAQQHRIREEHFSPASPSATTAQGRAPPSGP